MKFSINERFTSEKSLNFKGEFAPGERVALLGISGAGKTTLLRYLAGLERAGAGAQINFDGLTNPKPWHSPAVLLHQTPVMYAHHTVEQTIQFASQFLPGKVLPIKRWAQQLEIEPLWKHRCTQISGGQKQRVALLRALATGRKWLLLDESFSALDPERLNNACDVIAEYCDLTGSGLVLASHNDSAQRYLCDSAYSVNELAGEYQSDLFAALRQFEQGRVSTLTANVIQEEHSFLKLEIDRQTVYLSQRKNWKPGHARISIPAGEVSIATSPSHDTSIVNHISGTIEQLNPSGEHRTMVTLNLGEQRLDVSISNWSAGRLKLESGQRVFAEFKVGAVRWHGQTR